MIALFPGPAHVMGMKLSVLLHVLFAQDQTRRKSEWSQCNRDTDGHWWTFQVWRKSSVQGEPWSNWYNYFCRSADLPTRQRYVALVESVKDNGGIIRIFSSLHLSGERKWLLDWSSIWLSTWHKMCRVLGIPCILVPWPPTQPSRAMWKEGSPEIILKSTILYHCFLSCAELGQLSGVAAILRFPLPDLEDSESDDSDG